MAALLLFQQAVVGADWNPVVLAAIEEMPNGGAYSVSSDASSRFRGCVDVVGNRLVVRPAEAVPSYCSSATYLVLLKVLEKARASGHLELTLNAAQALAPAAVPDGHGVWGRWNANGPGTARLFAELGAGPSFIDYERARPGDFMKIFWRDAVGKNERGHLVVYLGTEVVDGEESVRFWSSNKPAGYGEKVVPRSEIARVIFSRLSQPGAFSRVTDLPKVEPYLSTLLEKESSFDEACRVSRVQ